MAASVLQSRVGLSPLSFKSLSLGEGLCLSGRAPFLHTEVLVAALHRENYSQSSCTGLAWMDQWLKAAFLNICPLHGPSVVSTIKITGNDAIPGYFQVGSQTTQLQKESQDGWTGFLSAWNAHTVVLPAELNLLSLFVMLHCWVFCQVVGV